MKFLFSDSLDFVDPDYDFEHDRNRIDRRPHEDDQFPHEHLDIAPYDGLLISRAIVGDSRRRGKYSEAQSLRFSREGARTFLRYPLKRYPKSMIMGDCGAFSYRNLKTPPYSVRDTLEFYQDGHFSHGCSVDHVIFEFSDDSARPSPLSKERYGITLANAESFFRESKALGRRFTPVGVIQGWSAKSLATAARKLVAMGYTYLAVGGMVPLNTRQISRALESIRHEIPPRTSLHVLGFGKTEDLGVLRTHRVTSFDTTSPLRRAFKDAKKNYYSVREGGELDYYTAIHIPQACDNDSLTRYAKRGTLNQDKLLHLEQSALEAVRNYARRRCTLAGAVDEVIAYLGYAVRNIEFGDIRSARRLASARVAYTRTLGDRPWEDCQCRVCRETGVEVVLFRSANRNKRRGIHNLHVFYTHFRDSM